jgi:uncharacterized DUF497 family protein
MRFEWDREKAASNLEKHGLSFQEAMTVFYDPLAATFADPHHSVREERWVTIGYSLEGSLLVVCHTDCCEAVRIISARRATPPERSRHEA